MENFVVSARKYRPSTFRSVVGQQALTTTLKNAIVSGRLAHAYLFCGPRGVGKTTCARIFAKTINCFSPTAEHEACNECESCRSFNEQRSMNIHELDAASNNSVDDIRDLITQVRVLPQVGKYSVFIIDEVHMLSAAAFNAFLKTLEEPPAHAIFILATTEKHKILPTILSRCQIYDFSRITIRDIIAHLQYVAQSEGVKIDEQSLEIIAQKADGGMRDALSIFDQLVSFSGKSITYQTAIETLNVLDTTYYFNLVDQALRCDVSGSLLLYDEILARGFDSQNFINGFGQHLRDLLVSKTPDTARLLESSEATMRQYTEQAQRCHPKFIFRALNIVNDASQQYRTTGNKRLCVELMLIRLCQIMNPDAVGAQQPKEKLQSLNSSSASSQPPPARPTTPTQSTQTTQTAQTATSAQQAQPVKQAQQAPNATTNAVPGGLQMVTPPNFAAAQHPAQHHTPQQDATPTAATATVSTNYGRQPYSQQMVQDAWRHFATQISDQRSRIVFEKLLPQANSDPKQQDTWVVNLYNDMQMNLIKGIMPQFNQELKRALSNDDVNVILTVAQSSEEFTYKPYMPQEKLEKMVKDNANLETLIRNLNLSLA